MTNPFRAFESNADMDRALKRGKSNAGFITFIPKDRPLIVRFLTERTGPQGCRWVGFDYWYDEAAKMTRLYVPGTVLPTASSGEAPSVRSGWLAPALDVTEDRVIMVLLTKSLVDTLCAREERYGTLTDRDYELSKRGQGFDTRYDAVPDSTEPRNLSRYEVPDLEAALLGTLDTQSAATVAVESRAVERPAVAAPQPQVWQEPAIAQSAAVSNQSSETDSDFYTEDDLLNLPIDVLRELAGQYADPARVADMSRTEIVEMLLTADDAF